jgi:hypothetical protein
MTDMWNIDSWSPPARRVSRYEAFAKDALARTPAHCHVGQIEANDPLKITLWSLSSAGHLKPPHVY